MNELSRFSAALVAPSLKNHAGELNTAITKFGRTVEQLLKRHRKGIVGECGQTMIDEFYFHQYFSDRQYELIRVANAAIDIYR